MPMKLEVNSISTICDRMLRNKSQWTHFIKSQTCFYGLPKPLQLKGYDQLCSSEQAFSSFLVPWGVQRCFLQAFRDINTWEKTAANPQIEIFYGLTKIYNAALDFDTPAIYSQRWQQHMQPHLFQRRRAKSSRVSRWAPSSSRWK